jgi:hypothetical protein
MRNLWISMIAVTGLCGCATTINQTEIDDAIKNKKGGIVVVNVEGKNVGAASLLGLLTEKSPPSLDIHKASDDGKNISLSLIWGTASKYSGKIQDGYAVLFLPESKVGETYVISRYNAGGLYGHHLAIICKGRETSTFKINNGDVLYLGHYLLDITSRTSNFVEWRISHRNDLDAAKAYVTKDFPMIASEMKPATLESRIPDDGARCN